MANKEDNVEKFVKFRIGKQEFCVEMEATRELRSWAPTTALPNANEYVIGIINLRGNILPIVNLATRLGLPASAQSDRHVVIVVQNQNEQFGILVDAVSDIISVGPDDIRPVPEVTPEGAEELFKQVIVQEESIICQILLDRLLPEMDECAA